MEDSTKLPHRMPFSLSSPFPLGSGRLLPEGNELDSGADKRVIPLLSARGMPGHFLTTGFCSAQSVAAKEAAGAEDPLWELVSTRAALCLDRRVFARH